MKLPFSSARGYGSVADKSTFGNRLECYMEMPIIVWLDKTVGAFTWPRESGSIVEGRGWGIHVDYSDHWGNISRKIKVYVVFDNPLSDIQVTEFLLRFA